MKAEVNVKDKVSKKGGTYSVIVIAFDNGIEIEAIDFNASERLRDYFKLIQSLGLD